MTFSVCTLWQDDDPYVRKTAAVCVAKLYDINPELVEDRGFLDLLKARALVLSLASLWVCNAAPGVQRPDSGAARCVDGLG